MKLKLVQLESKYSFEMGKLQNYLFNNYKINWLDQVTSTMNIVDSKIRSNCLDEIVVANYQTDGQGRFKRKWHSPLGKDLLLSIPMKLNLNQLSKLPILISLSICKVIVRFLGSEKSVKIKWPNDIFVNGKKISGLVIRATKKKSIVNANIGIGINVNSSMRDFLKIDHPATSLLNEIKKDSDRQKILYELIRQISYHFNQPYADCFTEWKKFLWIPKNKILLKNVDHIQFNEIECLPIGVDDDGLLIVQTSDGKNFKLTSEEVTFQY